MNRDRKVQKVAVLTEVWLADGSIISGNIFQPQTGRLSDVLNDERKFLPVQTVDGNFVAIAKSAIHRVSLPTANPEPYRGSDPWQILGVKEGVSVDELKQAYHKLVRAHHPDRIKGMGLASEYEEIATKNLARINDAYAEILTKMSKLNR
ncbi:MAG: J domain-containing protein [Alphaproteobacteria bacterium]|nr:J domain-containing protein [Alphaproteobacteria bacterium]